MSALQSIASVVPPAIVERLGRVLIHSLWQIALVALLAAILVRAMKRRSAAARYGLLIGSLVFAMLLPVATWFLQASGSRMATDAVPIAPVNASSDPTSSADNFIEAAETSVATMSPEAMSPEASAPETGAPENNPPGTPAVAESEVAAPATTVLPEADRGSHQRFAWLVGCWVLGVVMCSLRPLLGWVTLRRLRHVGVSPVGEEVLASLVRVSKRLGLRRHVQVLQSSLAQVPLLVGYARPVVLLPISVVTNIPTPQLEAILGHELAHIRRHDFVVNLLQMVVETLCFYHPAVWWLSHRIRVEREHCCDDLVVTTLGNRTDYGRALVAIEQLRGQRVALALGATDGPLLHRVRRLTQLPAERTDGAGWAGLCLLACFVAVTCCLSLVGDNSKAATDQGGEMAIATGTVESGTVENGVEDPSVDNSPAGGGQESNGLQCHLATTTSRTKNMTFVVRLQNVSDEPLTLVGVRRSAKGQPRFDGKPDPAFYAPHLFEFEFMDSDGHPIPRVRREFIDDGYLLNSVLTEKVAPGDSLEIPLRPSTFHPPMDHQLPPGTYRVRVHYRGQSAKTLAYLNEHLPDNPRINAWTGDAVSNEVAFVVPKRSHKPHQHKLVWGQDQDGLQAAVELRPVPGSEEAKSPPGILPTKPHVLTIFHVKNVSKRTITFVSETGRQGDECLATDETGETKRLQGAFFTGVPIVIRWTLKPGEVAELQALTSGVGLLWKPGKYTLRYGINFGSLSRNKGEGESGFPKPKDYRQVLYTGDLPMTIRARPEKMEPIAANGEIVGHLLDAETGEPITGAAVACNAVMNASNLDGRANAVTDGEGRYRLIVPSPGVYNVWLRRSRKSWMTAAADDGIVVEAGKRSQSELRLINERKITGRVVDGDGQPIEYLVVSCYSPARPFAGGVQSVRTKADGGFVFSLPPGRAYIFVLHDNNRHDKNPMIGALSADAHVFVSANGKVDPAELILQKSESTIDSTDWVRRTTPGTRIVGRQGNQNVTGTVVDRAGKPITTAKVFHSDGPMITVNSNGGFEVETRKTQWGIYAFAPGYHVWTGTPSSGDVLHIVLEPKQPAERNEP